MKRVISYTFSVCMAVTFVASTHESERQANIIGGGSPNRGKCTIEVVVDGVAQIEIRGTSATLRDISGLSAEWRRFDCTGVMPVIPGDFKFQGVDGRGRQTLVSDPRQGGVAVVEIEDKQSGSEAYTFDLIWNPAEWRKWDL